MYICGKYKPDGIILVLRVSRFSGQSLENLACRKHKAYQRKESSTPLGKGVLLLFSFVT